MTYDVPIQAVLDEAEERGTIEETVLEALALEHELEDDELAALRSDLDREALPEPQPAPARPLPGGRDRAEPRGREVRLAARLQVLDLRHLVDPAGLPAGGVGAVRHDPDPDACPRAPREARRRLGAARAEARAGADPRGARGGDGARAPARGRGPGHRRGSGLPQPADRVGGGRRVRRPVRRHGGT